LARSLDYAREDRRRRAEDRRQEDPSAVRLRSPLTGPSSFFFHYSVRFLLNKQGEFGIIQIRGDPRQRRASRAAAQVTGQVVQVKFSYVGYDISHLFNQIMQNKANLLHTQMNVSTAKTKEYENKRLGSRGENKPKQTRSEFIPRERRKKAVEQNKKNIKMHEVIVGVAVFLQRRNIKCL